MVLVLAKCGKVSDVHAAGSAVTAILKKAVPAVNKSCDNYHEKVVPAVRKSCDSYHEKPVSAVKKSCLLWAEATEVRWVISDCWRGHSAFIGWIRLKNGKISLKGILLF